MALPNVYITVNRSGLGQIAFTDDSIMGLVVGGVSVANAVQVGTAYAIYNLSDAEKLSVTETANPGAWKQIKEFYDEAGSGQKMWFILHDEDLMSDTVDGTSNAVRTLIETANGEIALTGLCSGKSQSNTIVDGLNEDVFTTMTKAQLLSNEYQEAIMPVSFVIEGIGFTGNENAVRDLHTMDLHRCSVLLSASGSDGVGSIGQAMGRLASLPVQRKISRIKNGALTNIKGYLTDGDPVDDRMNAMGVLHDKGYIVYRTLPGRTGYFYSGDPTATLKTDDLNIISRNRIIDKALKITYNTYVEELDDDVDMTDEGDIEPAVCANLQNKIEQQINGNMSAEISSFIADINPKQNLLSGLPLEVNLYIVPRGYLGTINVTIGFNNPFSN
jgi:hypothetical protein